MTAMIVMIVVLRTSSAVGHATRFNSRARRARTSRALEHFRLVMGGVGPRGALLAFGPSPHDPRAAKRHQAASPRPARRVASRLCPRSSASSLPTPAYY